jgi:DNA-binding transcriptional regulator YiaG
MHSGRVDPLEAFVSESIATAHNRKDDDDERQTALKEHAQTTRSWRDWLAQPHEQVPTLTGQELREIREAVGLSPSTLAELLNVNVADIASAEGGAKSFAESALRKFAGAARDALNAQGS